MSEQKYQNAERVDHPSHYGGADDLYETIKVLEAKMTPQAFAGYLEGCARKYLDRHLSKEGMVDVEKATWFVNRLHQFLVKVGYDAVYGVVNGVRRNATVPTNEILKKATKAKEHQREIEQDTVRHVVEIAAEREYRDFPRAVHIRLGISRAKAEEICQRLGYDRTGKKI